MSTPTSSFRVLWKEPNKWFAYFDQDHTNSLDKDEIVQGLGCTFSDHMDTEAIYQFIEALWPLFDTDKSGKISYQEFVQPGGLYDTINAEIQSMPSVQTQSLAAQSNVGSQPSAPAYVPNVPSVPMTPIAPITHMAPMSTAPLASASSAPATSSYIYSTAPLTAPTAAAAYTFDTIYSPGGSTSNATPYVTTPYSGAPTASIASTPMATYTYSNAPPIVSSTPYNNNSTPYATTTNVNTAVFSAPMHNAPQQIPQQFPQQFQQQFQQQIPQQFQQQIPQQMPQSYASSPRVRRALLIGVNYFNTPAKLNGCINDTQNIRDLLITVFGWPADNILVLRDDSNNPQFQPTHANILQAMRWLVAGAKRGDSFFFSFSGHGTQQPDPHGYEEDGMNECVLPVDYKRAGVLSDDTIATMIVHTLPEGSRLTAVLDSCHSGTGLDLPYEWTDRGWREEVNPCFCASDVQMFSGCTDDGTSCDVGASLGASGGALTNAFCSILRGNSCPTYVQLLDLLRRRMRESGLRQHPLLASTQPFDFNRPFHLEDAVANRNRQLGRVVRRKFPPRVQADPLRPMLFGNATMGGMAGAAAGVLGGIFLADMFS